MFEPAGKVGAFLAERYKQYVDDRAGASKVIWDLAATGWIFGAVVDDVCPHPEPGPDRRPDLVARYPPAPHGRSHLR